MRSVRTISANPAVRKLTTAPTNGIIMPSPVTHISHNQVLNIMFTLGSHTKAMSVVDPCRMKGCRLLRGRPIGRITRLARPSVRMSVHLSVLARNSKTKKRRKTEVGIDVP